MNIIIAKLEGGCVMIGLERMKRFGIFLAILWMPLCSWAFPDEKVGEINLSISPSQGVFSASERFLYLMDATSAQVSIVDLLTFSEISTFSTIGTPRGIEISDDGLSLYVLTSNADVVYVFDLEDAFSDPVEAETISIGTSAVTFEHMELARLSGGDQLLLVDEGQERLYVYDIETEELQGDGGEAYVQLDFVPVGMGLTPDHLRVALLSEEGQFVTYLLSSLSQVGGDLDMGAYTDTESFSALHMGDLNTGTFGFVVNSLEEGEVFLVDMTDNTFSLALYDSNPNTANLDPLLVGDTPRSLLLIPVQRSLDDEDESDIYLYVSNSGDDTLSIFDGDDVGASGVTEALDTLEGIENVPIRGLISTSDASGYLFALNETDQKISIVTDQPFLTFVSSPEGYVSDGEIEVVCSSSKSGSLKVYRYLGEEDEVISPTNGTLLTSQSITADVETTITVPTDTFEEGGNTLSFFVENGDLLGHGSIEVYLDTVPATPDNFSLAFGDEKIYVRWDGVEASDMDHYLLYFGSTSDAEGGIGSLSSPRQVTHTGTGEMEEILSPIPNGTEVFVRLVAVDERGNVSESTSVLSETAEETQGLLDVVEEHGGCQSREGVSPFWLFLCSVWFWVLKRARFYGMGFVLFSFLIIPSLYAQEAHILKPRNSNSFHSSIAFRVGWWLPHSTAIEEFYGKKGNEHFLLRAGFGWKGLDLGVESGVMTETSSMQGVSSGRASGESMRLTRVPITMSAQYALSISWLGPVSPMLRAGYDFGWFKASQANRSESGIKHSVLGAAGLRLHLNELGFGGDMEELMGVKAFFLEALAQYMHQFSSGLDFGGWMFSPGLGIEF